MRAAAILAALFLVWASIGATAQERRLPTSGAEIELSLAPLVRYAAPAVVNISSTRRTAPTTLAPLFDDPFFRQFFERFRGGGAGATLNNSLGSGVIIDPQGLIVTNHHVVKGATEIRVILADRREYDAQILRTAEEFDVALLQIDTEGRRLPYLDLGDSDAVEVGDLVVAIGNPFGIGQSVSSGIVSATARATSNAGIPFLQTDAAINPGNSGGALVTLDGRVVGINSAIVTRGGGSIGIGFAIPATYVRAFVRGRFDEKVSERPWFGADVQTVDSDLGESLGLWPPRGVVIQEVFPEGPAAEAGLERGDVVVTFDGVDVIDRTGIELRLALYDDGAEVPMKLWRQGEEVDAVLAATAPPAYPEADPVVWDTGRALSALRLANLSPALAVDLGVDPFSEGVVVLDVQSNSQAGILGLRPRDIIVDVAGMAIRTHGDLEAALRRDDPRLRMIVQRGVNRLQVYLR